MKAESPVQLFESKDKHAILSSLMDQFQIANEMLIHARQLGDPELIGDLETRIKSISHDINEIDPNFSKNLGAEVERHYREEADDLNSKALLDDDIILK